jgi:hypothetical protein
MRSVGDYGSLTISAKVAYPAFLLFLSKDQKDNIAFSLSRRKIFKSGLVVDKRGKF